MRKTGILFSIIFWFLTTSVMGQGQDIALLQRQAEAGNAEAQYEFAIKCADKGDLDNFILWLEKAGEQGHEKAIELLITIYLTDDANKNTPVWKQLKKYENEEKAFYWTKKWAVTGKIKPMTMLANFYYLGIGVKSNPKEACAIYKKLVTMQPTTEREIFFIAAAEGMLGSFYEGGQAGLEQDDEQAAYWYKRAVGRNVKGQNTYEFQLAKLYLDGNGVKQDYDQAIYWFEKAKVKGHKDADTWITRAKERRQQAQASANQSVAPKEDQLPALPTPVLTDNVDDNIPQTNQTDDKTYVVIIGNESYENEADVPYAEHDAKVFKDYVQQTLGVPENHIRLITNAGLNRIRGAVRWLKEAMEAQGGQGKVLLYYAGHGIPDEANKDAYLLPVDGMGSDVESAYPLNRLYKELSALPAERITIFLDACFSGAKREGDMMASARGIAIKVKKTVPQGKMVVFTAAQGDETAYPYKSQKHGMFTYYLLKKLQETQGHATLGDLSDYLIKEVKRQSFVENNKMQTPTVVPSPAMQASWRSMKLK